MPLSLLMLVLLPLDAAGKPGLLLFILPVIVIFGIFWGVYLVRQRSNRQHRQSQD